MRHGLLGAAFTTQERLGEHTEPSQTDEATVCSKSGRYIAHLDGLLRANSSNPVETGGS
jgi:hypothetical protein